MFIVAVVLGTRPEAIKFAPILRALGRRREIELKVIVTGQQPDLLSALLEPLGIIPDCELSVMVPGQSVHALLRNTVRALAPVVRSPRPHALLVQGDTTTALAGALVGGFEQVPVVHVEAGLRSYDFASPYPEEANRVLISHIASRHCAPTSGNVQNLLAEGIAPDSIVETGNPVVDAVSETLASARASPALVQILARHAGHRRVVMTAHRRENFGERLTGYLAVTREFISHTPDAALILPVHPNPQVVAAVDAVLGKHERIELIEPLVYHDFLLLLQSADLVLSDSGGIQEEIAVTGSPLIVLRNTTERPEILATGRARLARDPAQLEGMLSAIGSVGWPGISPLPHNPFGDGHSGERIAELVTRFVAR